MGFPNNELDDENLAERKLVKGVKIITLVILFLLAFGIGLLVGAYLRAPACSTTPNTRDAELQAAHRQFQTDVNATELGANLKYFSESPHIAGSVREKTLADELKKTWDKYGFDTVEMPRYKVLISLPRTSSPNKVQLIDNTDKVIFTAKEDVVEFGMTPPFLSYSPNATIKSRLTYANYGRDEDFQQLKAKFVDVTGSIAIMRLGKVYPGNMVANAAAHGAEGAILYADPAEYAQEGMGSNKVYPQTSWLPEKAILFGSAYARAGGGDPLTPDIPALEGMYRQFFNQSDIPKIPAQTISYEAAKVLLEAINTGGVSTPKGWTGGLGIDYRVGPHLKSGQRVQMIVNNEYIEKDIYNVIGTIQGQEEPDRYVLLGSHRDAWQFGAAYAAGGTSVTSEIARTIGQLRKNNWRPRRTIKICSWGGSAPGLLGSVEWVEQHAKVLEERAVGYINLDAPVRGNFVLNASASPLMNDVIYDWVKQVKDPNDATNTKTMSVIINERIGELKEADPPIHLLAGASDFVPFLQNLGVSAADFHYAFGYKNRAMVNPLLNSRHDTFDYIKNKLDPKFQFHLAMAKLAGGILLDMAGSRLLPMNTTHYSAALTNALFSLKQSRDLEKRRISLNVMDSAVTKFKDACEVFEKRRAALQEQGSKVDEMVLRQLNDQTIRVERAFINPRGLPGQRSVKHVIFAPSLHNLYNSTTFPGIHDAMSDAIKSGKWGEVERQISLAATSILGAKEVLASYVLLT